MTTLKTISPKQHEALIQQKRQEREIEDRRLDRLKIGLMQKIEAGQMKSANIRVA